MKEKKTCSIEGCGKNHYAKGLCRQHYKVEWNKSRIVNQDRQQEMKRRIIELETENRVLREWIKALEE